MLDTIPGPLRDRMEIIELAGYTEEEKLADRPALSRAPAARGERPHAEQVEVDDEALRADHPRLHARGRACASSSARSDRALRHAAVRIAEGSADAGSHRAPTTCRRILGAPRFENEVAERTSVPGRGDRPRLDAGRRRHPVHRGDAHARARAGLILTGQLGDVMRESAAGGAEPASRTALHRSASTRAVRESDIHIHVPAGATPKDGPSAGVAMFTALVSLLTGRTVRSDTAMTGEISLARPGAAGRRHQGEGGRRGPRRA